MNGITASSYGEEAKKERGLASWAVLLKWISNKSKGLGLKPFLSLLFALSSVLYELEGGEMAAKEILYFDRPGRANTEEVVKAVQRRAQELGVQHVVVASNTGETALKFWPALQGMGVKLVSVTAHVGAAGGDKISLTEDRRKDLEGKGVNVLTCSHALSGVGRSITQKFGGISHVEIIAHTLRLLGQGIKVAVEVSIMAADSGLVPTDREIIAVGGTARGADSAIVLKASHMNNFFDLEIREIIAKPRQMPKEK